MRQFDVHRPNGDGPLLPVPQAEAVNRFPSSSPHRATILAALDFLFTGI